MGKDERLRSKLTIQTLLRSVHIEIQKWKSLYVCWP